LLFTTNTKINQREVNEAGVLSQVKTADNYRLSKFAVPNVCKYTNIALIQLYDMMISF
jgi:hypothetical protein